VKKSNLSGASNRTIIVTLAVLGFLFFLGLRIGPTYYNEMSLGSAVDGFMAQEGGRMGRTDIIAQVIKLGADNDVKLTNDQVSVEYGPDPNQMKVRIKYTATADLIFIEYTRDVEINSRIINRAIDERVRQDLNNSSPPVSYPSQPTRPSSPSAPPPGPAGPYSDRAREAGKKIGGEPQ